MPFTLRSFRNGFTYMLRDLGGFFMYLLPWVVFTGVILKLGYVYGYQDRLMVWILFFAIIPLVLLFPRLGYWLRLFQPHETIRRVEVIKVVVGVILMAMFINLCCNPWLP